MADRRVFVLGAGFSHHAGFPLVKDLLAEVVSFATSHEQWRHEKLQRRFLEGLSTVPSGEFEEVFRALMSRRAECDRLHHSADPCYEATDVLREATTRLLWQHHEHLRELPPQYVAFGRRLFETHSVVISFNWDVLLESAVSAQGGDYWGYSLSHSAPVSVLKPHGSINWSAMSRQGASPYYPDLWLPVGKTQFRYPTDSPLADYDPNFVLDHGGSGRHMIFPGDPDDPSIDRDLKLIWEECASALRAAERIVFIGYSLPDYDAEAARFLREHCRGREVEVVNPSPAHRRHLEEVIGAPILDQSCGFEVCSYARPTGRPWDWPDTSDTEARGTKGGWGPRGEEGGRSG